MDPGPYVRTLYNNSNQAEISQSGTRDGVHMCHIWYLRQNKNAHMIFQWILLTHVICKAHIIIVVQCPDTWARVQSVQIPDSDISARLSLLHSVRTHWPESNQYKYPIPTFLPDYNCCTVSGHIGPGPNDANTRIKHFSILRIVVQCLDTLAQV